MSGVYPQRSDWEDDETWVPMVFDLMEDLLAPTPVPTLGAVVDSEFGLFYAARINGLGGESGSGKGWIALATASEQMRGGGHVYYLDWEDSAELLLQRLCDVMQFDPLKAFSQFHYVHPASHDLDEIHAFVQRVAETPGALVVIDSVGESMAAAGLDQNRDEDVSKWFRELPDPLSRMGHATVLLIDHTTKSRDGGLWPIGSHRKRAAITGVQYMAEVVEPFSRNVKGSVALRVAKDRHGWREYGSTASVVHFEVVPVDDYEQLTVTFGPGRSLSQDRAHRALKAAAGVAADVAAIAGMERPPAGYREVKEHFGWSDHRAQVATREYKRAQG